MNRVEKFTIGSLVTVLTVAFSIYGMWEEKMTFLAPLMVLTYIAFAMWSGRLKVLRSEGRRPEDGLSAISFCVASAKREALATEEGQRSEPKPFSSFIFHLSFFQTPPGGVCLLLFWLYSAIRIPFSVIPYDAKISTLRLGCYVGTYFITTNLLSRFPRRKAVLTTLFTALVLVALYSLVQHRLNPEMLFGFERYTNYGERLGGTYICPNHIAHLFQMWLPFCAVFLFLPQLGWFWRICFGYAMPLFALLIYQTQSRAGLLGTIAALTMTALMVTLRKSRKAFFISLLVIPLLGAAGLGALWAGSSMFRDRMQPVVKVASAFLSGDVEQAISIDFRPKTWADALVMFKDRPVFGFGPGNYELVFPEYRKRLFANKVLTVHPHNEPIELLTEYGLVGAALFAGALIGAIVPLVRLIKTAKMPYHALPAAALIGALAGTFVHGLFDFELRIFPNAMMLALLAGCAVAPLLRQQDRHETAEPTEGRRALRMQSNERSERQRRG